MPQFYRTGPPGRGWERGPRSGEENATRNGSPDLPVQNQGSQQVSPPSALGNESARAIAHASGVQAAVCFAGVAQLVEHLFCKQVVRGSIPRASSSAHRGGVVSCVSEVSESCPSGQREQAVNLPAYAYAGSNPALSTSGPLRGPSVSIICLGSSAPPRRSEFGGAPPQVFGSLPKNTVGGRMDVVGELSSDVGAGRVLGMNRFGARSFRPVSRLAGVAQLVERQPSKLNVESSSLFSRSTARRALAARGGSHGIVTETSAHLAQLVEHVLGKDEVTSSNLVVGSKH